MLRNILKNVFIKNFFNLSLTQGLNILLAIVITPILYQNLGQANFGVVSLYFSVVTLLNILVSYGYHLNGPKRIAIIKKNKKKLSLFLEEVISLRVFLASSIFCLLFFTILILELDNYTNTIIFLFSLICLFRESILPDFFLQGKDKLFLSAINNFYSKTLYLVLVILFIKTKNEAYLVNFFFGVSAIFVYILFWFYLVYKNEIYLIKLRFKNVYSNLKNNFKFFLSSIAGHLSIHSSLIILSRFVNDIELGQFALAHRVVFLLRLVPTFFVQSILQKASVMNNKKNLSSNFLNKFFYSGLFLTLILALFVIIFSKYIIFILSGELVILSEKVVSILSFIPFLAMLNFKNMIFILVNELKDDLNSASWISSLIMIFSAIVGSYYNGSIGLCYSLLFSEIMTFIVFNIKLKKYERN